MTKIIKLVLDERDALTIGGIILEHMKRSETVDFPIWDNIVRTIFQQIQEQGGISTEIRSIREKRRNGIDADYYSR